MDLNTVFPRALKAEDLNDGKKTLTIKGVELKTFEDEKGNSSSKPVFSFEEVSHWLVSNKTNTETIVNNLGTSDSDAMVGKKITLRKDRTQFGSRQVDCIRVDEKGGSDEPY